MTREIPSWLPLLALLVAVTTASLPVAAEESPPNVILILADDLGYGDLSCYGSEKMRTPVLDRLAAGGVRLTNFHTGATVCTPSRMALLTGCYPPRLGWRGGVLGYRMSPSTGLAPEARTIAEVFQDAGYRTSLSGKWHLGSTPELGPTSQGFDEAFFIKMSNNQTKKLWRNEVLVADPFDNRRLSEQFTRSAIEAIEVAGEDPFFLYLPFTAPHFPAEAHPEWEGRSENSAYGDVVEELDSRIGEILGTLRERDLEKRTIVVFLSDNGPEPSQAEFATAAPYLGQKWSSREGGTRVPCIISWPGVLPAGAVRSELVAAIDLLPTLARACGIDPGGLTAEVPRDGRDAWDLLRGLETSQTRTDLLYWSGWAIPQAIQSGDWKLYFDVVKGVPGTDAGPALFDLATDPAEKTNLSLEHPDKVAALMARARGQLAEIERNSIPLGGPPSEESRPEAPRWLE